MRWRERVKGRAAELPEVEFSLVDDPLLRLQRALRLAPRQGFAPLRRALFFVAISWLPIMVWAAASGHLQPAGWQESLTSHLGIHVRCLLAIPLFVLSEPLAHYVIGVIVGNFPASGLIRDDERGRFSEVLRSVERWRDSKAVWAGIVVLVVGAVLGVKQRVMADPDAFGWGHGALSTDFGSAWAIYVVRPLFFLMALAWLWRLIITWILFQRLARLDLRLVPSHPDSVGGLGFIELHSLAFCLVVFAMSSVACAAVAHQMMAHGGHFKQFQAQLIVLVILVLVLVPVPLAAVSS